MAPVKGLAVLGYPLRATHHKQETINDYAFSFRRSLTGVRRPGLPPW